MQGPRARWADGDKTQNSHLLSAGPGAWFSPALLPSPVSGPTAWSPLTMNKMKNFKRRLSLSVPRTETIEESLAEFTEQFSQLHNRRDEGEGSGRPPPRPDAPHSPSWPSLTWPTLLGEDRGGAADSLPLCPGQRDRVGS